MTPEPARSTPPLSEPRRESQSTPPMSEISRLAGVFVSPGAAFADIARRPSWWVPVVLSTVFAIAYLSAFSNHVGWRQLIVKQMDQSPRTQNMTGAQREQAIEMGVRFAPVIGYIGAAIGTLLAVFIIAVVLMFLFDNIMGADIGLKRMLAIVAYGGLPRVLMTALA